MVTIPLYSDSTYMSLCSDVCSRFDELEVGAFEISYLVADYPPCLLESDLDVRVMYLSLLNEKKNIVTIAVKECQLPDEGNGADDVFGSSTRAAECAYAPTEDAFEMHMRTLKDEGGAVIREFLKNLPKENWSAAYFPEYFTVEHFKKCYNIPIFPIPDIDRHAQEAGE
ncbi:hypothetical protein Pyn_18458 [Prunus yedoensis var. nudiflora]|uniref:Uncharacterized protein n=1 Tax=Prunus yedoensis var. nudiflora TaxID=2094558 RepID=A0A315ASD0_PRUYE|nr:hypothetical protein Pyn_18458 [Prunus yedoensis var. nudiflora]